MNDRPTNGEVVAHHFRLALYRLFAGRPSIVFYIGIAMWASTFVSVAFGTVPVYTALVFATVVVVINPGKWIRRYLDRR